MKSTNPVRDSAFPRRVSFIVALLWLVTAALTPGTPGVAEAVGLGSASAKSEGAVLGPKGCAECHVEEFGIWKESRHEVGSKLLTRSKEARKIAKALGIRSIKREARCIACHYTALESNAKSKVVAGVSCESCHGPAGDWVDLHQEFGAAGTTIEQETAAHRDQRSTACDDVGMVRPDRVHRMAERCFTCHVIDDEELVEIGGHPGGASFELVSWSQGEMRHNFIRGGGDANPEASLARRRMMFIAGHMLDLKYSLLALSKAKGDGEFVALTIGRVERSLVGLEAIQERLDISEVTAVLDKCAELPLAAGLEVDAAIQRIDHCSAKLEARADGSEFAAIDEFLPEPESYVGAAED